MFGLTKADFTLRRDNFNLMDPWNILRIICGAFMFPHALSKFAHGGLNPAVVGFFDKAGFYPPQAWIALAFLVEFGSGLFLVLGLCTRFAALGAAGALAVAVYALHVVKGFGWLWNLGGYEYPVFWALTALAVALHGFQKLQEQ